MKKNTYFFIALLLIFISVLTAYTQSVSENFVRFHIIADSNSSYDQLVKINLRNHILSVYEDELKACERKEETLGFFRKNLKRIEKEADLYLKSIGYPKTTMVSLEESVFPEKNYGDFTLPYGKYDALKITIGSGKGKNFFCVMFPPACVSREMTGKVNEILNNKKIIYKFKLFQKGA